MSTISLTLSDSTTMLRRNLLHAKRYPSLTLQTFAMPIVMLLLFVGVFGGAIGSGIESRGGTKYIDYVVPGIILMVVAFGSMSTAISVCTDMSEGIIARFRTMSISRASVMTGHVVSSMILTIISVVLVIGVAVVMGFRPQAGVLDWFGLLGILTMITFGLTWLTVALGLVSKTPEEASNLAFPISFLPFISSAFVPTDSMPTAVAWFAENQPFTPMIETMRGLLMGTPIGNSWLIAIGWCVAATAIGFVWAQAAYSRDPSR